MGTSPLAIASSPPSPTPTLMDFPTAIRAVIGGERITKLEWNDPNEYAELRGEWLMIRRDGEWKRWTLNDGDLLGRDWVILE